MDSQQTQYTISGTYTPDDNFKGTITRERDGATATGVVSAIDENDSFASFSSYGPEIDLTAPGVDIKSTYKDGSYETMEGTSMSAPHVTGTIALILKTKVKRYDFDHDGIWDLDEIKMKLTETAEELPILNFQQQGAWQYPWSNRELRRTEYFYGKKFFQCIIGKVYKY